MTKKPLSGTERTVSIPESFLLTIAVYGNMGDGDLPKLMQIWAENKCKDLGLASEMSSLRNERYEELKQRVSNVFGSDTAERIEKIATLSVPVIKNAMRLTNGKETT